MNIYYTWAFRKAVKTIFWIFVVMFVLWHIALKKNVYQQLYGTRALTAPIAVQSDIFQNLPSPTPGVLIKGRDYTVQAQFVKSFYTTAKIIYIDRYNLLGTWYRSSEYGRNAKLYDWIVPLDLAWVTGPMNYPKFFDDYDVFHEYRVLEIRGKRPRTPYFKEHISNNHIIPANKNIAKGLNILKVNDTVFIEGYLVHLKGLKQDWRFKLMSALEAGEISQQLIGGQQSGKCRLIYVTRLIFNGYEFK